MSPNNETVRTGEYGVLDDVTCLDHFPTLDYFAKRPGRSVLIIDDLAWNLSRKGSPSQYELADRICGHVSSHHEGGLSIFIAQQTHTGIPPNIRRLASHWNLFPRRIAVDSIGHIARSCMLEKATMRKLFDFCDGPYDFVHIENIPSQSCMVFIRQNAQHVCIDRSELSLAAAGINVLGGTVPVTTSDPVTAAGGTYLYDSRLQEGARDPDIDPRRASIKASADLVQGLERTAPCFFESLQVQCGGAIQPREALSEMSPPNGEMSRAWQLYTEFVGRSQGFRGAVLSYSEFCGSYSSNHASGPRCGDRGCFFLFDLQQKPGSLASTLEIRGLLNAEPDVAAKQELVVVCVSDSIMNIGYQSPSETAVLTEIQPIIGG